MPDINLKTRREFLRGTMLGGAMTWTVPVFLERTFAALQAEAADAATQAKTGRDQPILVVIQLAGGNDGLNTIIPVGNDHYYKARPSLALRKNLLRVEDGFAFHPALDALQELYQEGWMSVVHGVGYPNPNRSHFRSTEIWHTASDARRVEKHGWLGRYFDHACAGADPAVGISIGRQSPQAFNGATPRGISLENPASYRLTSADRPGQDDDRTSLEFIEELSTGEGMEATESEPGSTIETVSGAVQSHLSPLDYIQRTALDAQVSSEKILSVSRRARNLASYPASCFAAGLKLTARLIAGGMPTRVYYLSQGGYDTHTNQAGTHERLLREFSSAMKAFLDDLKAQGNAGRVVVMTFSEFGRRVAQNANNGTDHGAAAPLFLFGPKVKPGLHGTFPGLAPGDLRNGDLRFTTDFRSVYAGLLRHWLQADPLPVLGRHFEPLRCV